MDKAKAATLALLLSAFSAFPAAGLPGGSSQDAEDRQVISAAIHGPAEVNLHDDAILKLPKGNVFLPAQAAAAVIARMGNPVRGNLIGLVLGGDDWMVVLEYVADGHVRDDGQEALNAAKLLSRMQAGSEEDRRRRQQGLETLRATRWLDVPRYDPHRHQLAWSVEYQTLGSNGAVVRSSTNTTTVALGRLSHINLNLVAVPGGSQKNGYLSTLMSGLTFLPGRRYEDFDARKDRLAPYSLSGLIAD
jgi:uncharacterized membrane-anchored protein